VLVKCNTPEFFAHTDLKKLEGTLMYTHTHTHMQTHTHMYLNNYIYTYTKLYMV